MNMEIQTITRREVTTFSVSTGVDEDVGDLPSRPGAERIPGHIDGMIRQMRTWNSIKDLTQSVIVFWLGLKPIYQIASDRQNYRSIPDDPPLPPLPPVQEGRIPVVVRAPDKTWVLQGEIGELP